MIVRTKHNVLALAGLLVVLALLAGCTLDPTVMSQVERFAALDTPPPDDDQPGNRLLVVSLDGNIYTMRPDGSEKFYLTADASDTRQYRQPTWSPSAEQIAWTETTTSDEQVQASLVVSRHSGQTLARYEVPYPPFYFSWSPDESSLAYLSNWISRNIPTIALRLLDFDTSGNPLTTLAEGQPLYFSWSPDSSQMVLHVGNQRLELVSLDGQETPLQETAASFPAPQWSQDGESLIFAQDVERIQRLVVSTADDFQTEEITDFAGRVSFTLSPDSRSLAYAITPEQVGSAAFGPLYVVDIQSGATRQLAERPVVAFFWSPDGEKLAFLETERIDGDVRLRWRVWDGMQTLSFDSILPSRTFLQDYLSFFDQYAQSMTIWAPDSAAFAYAGQDQTGRSGIWVQRVKENAGAVLVGRGVFVAWSPQ